MMRRSKLALVTIGLLVAASFLGVSASAATPNPGITVSPARLNFILSKDATSQQQTIIVTNNYDRDVSLAAQLQGIDENAGLLVPTGDPERAFAAALKLSETNLHLTAHQAHPLTVQINNSAKLAGGGHYATLVLTQQDGGKSNGLNLRAAISISIFAIKTEGEKQSLTVSDLRTDGWLFKLPSHVSITYRNLGNVQIVPRAAVTLGHPDDEEPIRKGTSNPNSVLVLPDKVWQDDVPLAGLRHVWWPSRQELRVEYRADGASIQKTVVRNSWYIPPVYPLLLLLLTGILLYLRKHRLVLKRPAKKQSETTRPAKSAPAQKPGPGKSRKITVTSGDSPAEQVTARKK
jgi:hypothetical protein